MTQSFHCAVSSLLCAEDNSSLFFCNEVGNEFLEDEFEEKWFLRNHRNSQQNQWDSLTGVPVQSDECLVLMIRRENEHLPACDYLERLRNGNLDFDARVHAIDWIFKVHGYFNFGPLCAYLAVNYFDRFLSMYDLPKGEAWAMQLLAVACLSLAAKMEEIEVPLCLDLQVGDAEFVFEARTIQKMERLVLSTLNWRMRSLTPFSFIECFFKKINGDRNPSRSSVTKSSQLILSMLKGIYFLEFRPSEIAAAVAISVAVETEAVNIEKALSVLTAYVQKDRVIKCAKFIEELPSLSGSLPQSPIGVLDAACLSYKTDDLSVPNKRRKLNGHCEVDQKS